MAIKNYTVTVGTTPTIVYKGLDPAGNKIVLSTVGSGKDVHFGGPGVTTTDIGFRLPNNTDHYEITVPFGSTLYAVVATTTAPVYMCVLDDIDW